MEEAITLIVSHELATAQCLTQHAISHTASLSWQDHLVFVLGSRITAHSFKKIKKMEGRKESLMVWSKNTHDTEAEVFCF